MVNSNPNMLDQSLDIQGSRNIIANKNLSDESLGLGEPVSNGTGAVLSSFDGTLVTITSLVGMTANSTGHFLTITGAANPTNNGTFPINIFVSNSSVKIKNVNAILPDANSITWIQRLPYSAQDDFNFERTDREAIKGVSFSSPIPSYRRPTDTTTDVPNNLNNIKSIDSRGFIVNKFFYGAAVNSGDIQIVLTSAGNLKHSNAINKIGIPCFDTLPFINNFLACYVELLDSANNSEIFVLNGIHKGEKIFGVTSANATISPNSVDITLYSCPVGSDININSNLYTWEITQPIQLTTIYGYFDRLDLLSDESLRKSLSGGNGGPGSTTAAPTFTNTFLLMGA